MLREAKELVEKWIKYLEPPTSGELDTAAFSKDLWRKHATQARTDIIEPNRGSTVKVERYVLCLSQDIVLGVVSDINITDCPDTNIRPQRVSTNAPCVGFAYLKELLLANVGVLMGGECDAYLLNPNAVGQALDCPTLSPANNVRVQGRYTGYTPPPHKDGQVFTFSVSLIGPATIVC